MEWQQIIGFYNLVRHGSFTRAAGASFRTQSAVSQQVRKLEEEIGCELVQRHQRKQFGLTAAGERMFEFASAVLEQHRQLLDDLSAIQGVAVGQIRLAAPFTTLYHLLSGPLKAFMKAYPHVEMTIYDRPHSKVLHLLKRNLVDIGVGLASHVPGDFNTWNWKEVENVLIVPRTHPLTRIRKPQPVDIARYPLIVAPESFESPGRMRLEDLFRLEALDYRVVMESGNVELSSRYVEEGLGISLGTVVKGLNLLRGRKITFISIDHLFPNDYVCLVTQKNRKLPAYMKTFIDMTLAESA